MCLVCQRRQTRHTPDVRDVGIIREHVALTHFIMPSVTLGDNGDISGQNHASHTHTRARAFKIIALIILMTFAYWPSALWVKTEFLGTHHRW